MPFVYDQTEIEWPDDDSDPAPPRADQFVYIPAPQFGGTRDPMPFSVPPYSGLTELIEPPPPSERQPAEPESQPRGLLGRLLGPRPPLRLPPPSPASYEESRHRSQRLREQRTQQHLAAMVPALKELGVRRIYCRYDGGNDEGFAWLDSMEMRDGTRLAGDARLDLQKQADLRAAAAVKRAGAVTDEAFLAYLSCGWLCHEWASILLGNSYGTGEYCMYGAFTVDLDACTISDDSNAQPVVQNIEIAE